MEETKTIHIQEKPDSITIKETAKGDKYFEVKCYGNAQTNEEELICRVKRVYDRVVQENRTVE